MVLTGLHLLLTYKCTFECDHCFVFGSPWQEGVLTLDGIETILQQAMELGTIEWIYFEGGEPFLYYVTLVRAVERAAELGFQVGIVTNGYWATDEGDAIAWLAPFANKVQDLSISCDEYHGGEDHGARVEYASAAALHWGIPNGVIAVAQPEEGDAAEVGGQVPIGRSAVRYRGRAAENLSARGSSRSAQTFVCCPCEDLRDPGRVHVDPFGHVHICQGITMGNLFEAPLVELVAGYTPDDHRVIGPLLRGGPLGLARAQEVPHRRHYADACHMCFETRKALRNRFPDVLTPDAAYGVPGVCSPSGGGSSR